MLPALSLISSVLGSAAPNAAATVSSTATGLLGGATTPASTTPAPKADFSSVLSDVANDTVGRLKKAESVSTAGLQGQASAQQVVEAVSSAQQSLQMALAVRDKVVSAYQEVSRMTM